MPRATITRTWKRPNGKASSRAGMSVSIMAPADDGSGRACCCRGRAAGRSGSRCGHEALAKIVMCSVLPPCPILGPNARPQVGVPRRRLGPCRKGPYGLCLSCARGPPERAGCPGPVAAMRQPKGRDAILPDDCVLTLLAATRAGDARRVAAARARWPHRAASPDQCVRACCIARGGARREHCAPRRIVHHELAMPRAKRSADGPPSARRVRSARPRLGWSPTNGERAPHG